MAIRTRIRAIASSEVRFKEINEAYEVLKDGDSAPPMTATAMRRSSRAAAVPDSAPALRRHFLIFSKTCSLAGQRGGRGGGRERGADLRYNMEITLEKPSSARPRRSKFPVSVTCESCSGIGAKAGTKPKTCSMCGGAGRVRQAQASSRWSEPARAVRAAAR